MTLEELIESWRNKAQALHHYVGEQGYVSALNHCADELEEVIREAKQDTTTS